MRSVILPRTLFQLFLLSFILFSCRDQEEPVSSIPLPEHPRPDFEREKWINLNGYWDFEFDSSNVGEGEAWFSVDKTFTKKILVPFPWGSPLSEVGDEADIAWYKRTINVPEEWKGNRVFLVVGASDWHNMGWIDGKEVGEYQGGYTPFEFELTSHVKFGEAQEITLRVDDSPHEFKLFGKQGYGNAKGIWQTAYLEARPDNFVKNFYFTPDIDNSILNVRAQLDQPLTGETGIQLKYVDESSSYVIGETIGKEGAKAVSFDVEIPDPILWTLDNPHLYYVELILDGTAPDIISTYFGMRKISVENLPGTQIPYVALNNKPIYLQTALDQAYHPEGFYTFPTDEAIRDEIWKAKEIGLNGQRVHIKVPIPRKLYWADRLGHLIMADVPNSWGDPDEDMQRETNVALEGMIARDYNHPSIFSWVLFNETWGLRMKQEDGSRKYLKETQEWVRSMYHKTKQLDRTRLVEDNSANRYDHVVTDINTWHAYLPGYAWKEFLKMASDKTFPGSSWNYAEGNVQTKAPMFNSECGNVWGYEGSTGDVDWSWDYHIMMNEFRRHPKVAGWLYTEHHDVINEWNGYWKYDRSMKFTGMEELVEGMRLNDMHSYIYLAPAVDLCMDVTAGQSIEIPVRLSVMTEQVPEQEVDLKLSLYGWNHLGEKIDFGSETRKINLTAWEQRDLETLQVIAPTQAGIYVYSMQLVDQSGDLLHSNFTTMKVTGGQQVSGAITFAPASFSRANWSLKQWDILNGLKVNGAGHGSFEYSVSMPSNTDLSEVSEAELIVELSAKPLNGKDREQQEDTDRNYMLGRGMHDPSQNPNSYPMTDEFQNPSVVNVIINGTKVTEVELEDDPADHRGILSWHAQPRDRKLREAGTYGYLVKVPIEKSLLEGANGTLNIRFEVDEASSGGLAIYGKDFGRYAFDPTILLK